MPSTQVRVLASGIGIKGDPGLTRGYYVHLGEPQ